MTSRTLSLLPADVSAIQAIETVNRHGASGVAVRAGDHFRVVAAEAIVHALRRDQNSRLSGVDFETLPSRELEFRGNDVTRVYIPASVASRSLRVDIPLWPCTRAGCQNPDGLPKGRTCYTCGVAGRS